MEEKFGKMEKLELLAMIAKPLKVFPLSSIKVAFMPVTVGHANGIFLLRKGEKRQIFPILRNPMHLRS
jgi:hypothetical protein